MRILIAAAWVRWSEALKRVLCSCNVSMSFRPLLRLCQSSSRVWPRAEPGLVSTNLTESSWKSSRSSLSKSSASKGPSLPRPRSSETISSLEAYLDARLDWWWKPTCWLREWRSSAGFSTKLVDGFPWRTLVEVSCGSITPWLPCWNWMAWNSSLATNAVLDASMSSQLDG